MPPRWAGCRRLIIGLVAFFTAWYLIQLAVVSPFGINTVV